MFFFLTEGNKKILIHKEQSRFPFSATARRDFEIFKKRWCQLWYAERETRFPFCIAQNAKWTDSENNKQGFALGKNVLPFFREAWNAYFIFRELWKDRFIFRETWSRPPLYHPLVCGIPQGSILGHLLFIIYINDLPNASNLLKTFLFADDTILFYSHKDPNQLIHVMNCELSKISEWFKVNTLSPNVAKTNYIHFSTQAKTHYC